MSENFCYYQPVNIVFGKNKLEENLSKELGLLNAKRPFLVIDGYFVKSGLADRLKNGLGIVGTFCEISPNPKTSEVQKAAELLRQIKADCVIAIGGGSTLDTAKVAACLCLESGDISEFFGTSKAFAAKLPTILCPTTSGTGSEVTKVAVLSNGAKKSPMASELFFASAAVIDPALTYSMPPKSVAICALDALCHALEGYYSKYHQPICDLYAMQAAKIILENVEAAYEKDEEALDMLSFASNLAGLAFAIPKTAAPHGISYALTTDFAMPHGEACAFTADKVLLVNKSAEEKRLTDFAVFCGYSSVEALAAKIFSLKKEFGLKCTLKDAGIRLSDIPHLARAAQNANTANNPVEMTEELLTRLFISLQ